MNIRKKVNEVANKKADEVVEKKADNMQRANVENVETIEDKNNVDEVHDEKEDAEKRVK